MTTTSKSAPAQPQLPPLPPVELNVPLGAEALTAWRAAFAGLNRAVARLANSKHAYVTAQLPEPFSPEQIDSAFAALQKPLPGDAEGSLGKMNYLFWQKEALPLFGFWRRPEIKLLHVLRFSIMTGFIPWQRLKMQPVFGFWLNRALDSLREAQPSIGLREIAAGFVAVGLDPELLGRYQLSRFSSDPFPWPAKDIWPYWAENLPLLSEYCHSAERFYSTYWRRNALEVLRQFPQPPGTFAETLWELALGNAKAERAVAQQCVANVPDKLDRILATLASGKADNRSVAADWLRQLRDPSTIDPLLVAFRKEKNDAAKGAIMSALERLEVPVEQFLDRKTLLAEANKGLSKGLPEAINWFPFDNLPIAHWADTGKRVDPQILRWWLAQQCKLKSPEPSPLLRRYCAHIRADERERLGQFILDAWIATDVAPITRDQAVAGAQRHAQMMLSSAQWMIQHAAQNPQAYATPPPPPKTAEEYFAEALPAFLAKPHGSAIESKGVLAVASACAGSDFAPTVQRYLKEWYGMRAAQCRALLQALAWVEHPSATQVLLATASRFRTKGIQDEANKQVHALADRKNWTLEELSDRTVPFAGLDENGVLELDFGSRKFKARLSPTLELALFDSDGKPIKSLPEPRKDDDEEKASAAKKLLGSAKKELKGVISMQRDRFYETMCVGRRWRYGDWERYLNTHPIIRHYTQRLVWKLSCEGAVTRYFRPLPDGTLTDADDAPVKLDESDLVSLAHEQHSAPEDSRRWREHLSDYSVEPLFEQFGRPTFTPSEEQKRDSELSAFEGHLLESFKLRGRATKLGYTRGQAQDGGWFYDYTRRLPSLGLEAVLEFSGNSLPEENRAIALRSLYFQRLPPPGQPAGQFHTATRVKLGELPPVLLSECWNDIRQIAAEGPGFDPEWEKKMDR